MASRKDILSYLKSVMIKEYQGKAHSIILYPEKVDFHRGFNDPDNTIYVAIVKKRYHSFTSLYTQHISEDFKAMFGKHLDILLFEYEQFKKDMDTNVFLKPLKEGDIIMAAPKKRTIEDILQEHKDEHIEILYDEIIKMEAPSPLHQEVLAYLFVEISLYIRQNNVKCKVYPAPFAVKIDDENYVEPDISVICDKSMINEKGCVGAPDWIIEITSPTTKRRDYMKKYALYGEMGVKEYWIVDPLKKVIVVHDLANETLIPKFYGFNDKVKSNVFDDLEIDFSKMELFE